MSSLYLIIGAAWLIQKRVGSPELESRLGTPEEALCRAEAMRKTRGYSMSSIYPINIVCQLDVKKRVPACHKTFKK
jgi:hypothetical protein